MDYPSRGEREDPPALPEIRVCGEEHEEFLRYVGLGETEGARSLPPRDPRIAESPGIPSASLIVF